MNEADKYTLLVELIGAVKGLLRIHDDPWHNSDVPHYEQLSRQLSYVKDAIDRYEFDGTFKDQCIDTLRDLILLSGHSRKW